MNRAFRITVGIGATVVAYSAGALVLSKLLELDPPENLPIAANIIVGTLGLAYGTWSVGTYWLNPLRDFRAIKNECMLFQTSLQDCSASASIIKSSARFSFWAPLMTCNALLRPVFTVGAYGIFFVCLGGIMIHSECQHNKK